MSKRTNPLLRSTSPRPIEPEIVDDDGAQEDGALMETFPGHMAPLSVRERKRLSELETVVTTNFKAFYEVGCALREICSKMLYRETHTTFSDYAKDLWDMARRTAYQYIESADIVDRLLSCTPEVENVRHGAQYHELLPQNERQARALAKYPEHKQIEIWKKAVETAEGRITASHIKNTARQIHGQVVREKVEKARERTAQNPAVKMSARFRAAFNEMLKAIEEERLNDWRETSPEEVSRHLRGLVQAIEAPL